MAGTVGANVEIDRRGSSWNGKVDAQGRGIVVDNQAPMDLDVALELAGRHVDLSTTATTPEGRATVAADVDGPYDITDAGAWKRLERKALRQVAITVDHVDLAKVGATGTVSGKLEITGTGASGDLALRGFVTKQGIVDADLTLSPDTRGPLGMLAQIKAQLEGVDSVTADAQLELPARPFDPAQWKVLGKRALHHATATLAPLDFDPAVLARAHVDQPYRGHVEASFDISEGAGSVTANIDVTKLAGGAIVLPLDAHVQANAGETGVHVTGSASVGKQTLVTLDATTPLTQQKLGVVKTLPLAGTIQIPKVPAEQIVAVLGRRDVSRGVVDGEIDLAGTIGKPAAQLALTASHVSIPASIAGRPPAQLDWLQIAGQWDGVAGELAISGREANGGRLAVAASGRPDQLKQFVATVSATKFDLAPFSAFAVGALSAARGTLDASLSLQGLDPATGQVDGHLDITNGRLPISALFGTLRSTNAHVEIANHEVDAKIEAKLGRGDLNGKVKITLVGSTPSKATANLTLHQISLVRALQPTIDAELEADFTHDTSWHGDLSVHKGHVMIATTGGVALLASDSPSDMQFTDQAPTKLLPLLQRPPPAKPWLVADVHLLNTGFEVVQDEVSVRGNVAGTVKLSLGDGVGMDGKIEATTQNIELLGARAQLDRANVTWDGSLDPMLDIAVLRELTDLTITANVTGRLSK
ncbi:MAG TPA: translocation/assembly module TamB domain-containing protein, partial [Kofleriaceae bacterium]